MSSSCVTELILGIKPFTRDPAKQVRYDAYLEGKGMYECESVHRCEVSGGGGECGN